MIIIAIVAVVMIGMIVPSAFAEDSIIFNNHLSIMDLDLVIKPLQNIKTFENIEKEFSINYPSDSHIEEGYVGGHGVKGEVRFTPIENNIFYLSVFGKIPIAVASEERIFEQLSFDLADQWSCCDLEIIKKYTKEVNGLKHHIIEIKTIIHESLFSEIKYEIISWVIVGDELWEINSYVNYSLINLALKFEYGQDVNFNVIDDVSKKMLESSKDSLFDLVISFNKNIDEPEKPKIPAWVNNTMQWYLDGVISEDEMISAIQYLVKEGIIDIS